MTASRQHETECRANNGSLHAETDMKKFNQGKHVRNRFTFVFLLLEPLISEERIES